MPSFVHTTAYLSIGGTDVSTYMESIDLDEPVEMQDDTRYGNTTRVAIPGLKSWTIRAIAHQDFANSLLDDILAAANGTVVAVEYRPTSAVLGTSNPKRTGNAALSYDSPVSNGQVGQVAKATITLHGSGPLTRAEV